MGKTKIEWCDYTWNPTSGCGKISEGCTNCYAERMSKRLAGRCGYPKNEMVCYRCSLHYHPIDGKECPRCESTATYETSSFDVTLHPDKLNEPLKWKKPHRVFVCSMGDLFHKDVPYQYIRDVFNRMWRAKHCTFMVLTKRPMNAWEWHRWALQIGLDGFFPLPNVWLGVTAENQKRADERIPILLKIPAAVRFVSVEPMLGEVDLKSYFGHECEHCNGVGYAGFEESFGGVPCSACNHTGKFGSIDWVICGAETGPGARYMDPSWARDLRDQCKIAGVPFFMKQMSNKEVIPSDLMVREYPEELRK